MICPLDDGPCTGTHDRRCFEACERLATIKRNVRPAMEGLLIGQEPSVAGRDQVEDLSGFPFPATRPKVEPPQEVRQAATMMFEYFTALTDAGFTEAQALKLIHMGMKGDDDNADD